ncbi:Metallo-dependent phosphatase-like protein [Lasiosphaeria miniovina]|uniref:Metallo-dependent phosphatase-like protein n=1 Tax=Lasiosphaeria miniovina TaxID=1954250 RepID=A0AA40B4R0_9PEZI|nr:Metallo-dependent phosphatase-like protein [Lasiosphaeria miniovina]KAK0727584.1 Metallo-dependent phosphatase-like protein [Lasiosphaeria miniovina]
MMKLLLSASCLVAACSGAIATASDTPFVGDHLISERKLSRRFIDSDGNYNISFYHINDVHAHLDQFSSSGTDCTNPSRGCYGGYSRVRTVLKETRPEHPDSLLLNVGDEFQGTMYFSYYGGEKIADTLNQLGFDAMTLGNHEFDRGSEYLGQFLDNLTFPIVSANIFSSNEKLNRTIKPFYVFEKYQLAVIGVTTETTPGISSPGPETTFTDPVRAVQDTVDLIRATTNITRIAAITHIGYEEDQRLASETTGLHLIMGGHSHTPLGDFPGAVGPYPTIVKNKDGDEVFIVTAYRWGEYLGYIDVTYDAAGKILEYHGAPIHLTNATAQDPELQAEVDAWRVPFQEFSSQVIGFSDVVLDQSTCQMQECTLGDFISDAMLDYRLNGSTPATAPAFAITNAGGIRATIDQGNVTRGEVLTAFPFGNAVVEVTMAGEFLWTALEGIVSRVSQVNGRAVTSFLQVSRGIRISFSPTAAAGSRLKAVSIGGAPLDRQAEYRVVTIDFVANGGDNFFDPPRKDFVILDTLDEVLVNYIKAKSPVNIALDGRIKAVSTSCKNRRRAEAGSKRGV